jgi:hypothetical protein
MAKKKDGPLTVRSNDLLCDDLGFLKQVIRAQARLLVAYRIGGGKPPEWVFDTIDKAKNAGIEC